MRLLTATADLKRYTHQVRLDGGVHPRAHLGGWVRRLGADLKVRVSECAADSVDSSVVSSLKKVDILEVLGARRIQTRPLIVLVLGQKL